MTKGIAFIVTQYKEMKETETYSKKLNEEIQLYRTRRSNTEN